LQAGVDKILLSDLARDLAELHERHLQQHLAVMEDFLVRQRRQLVGHSPHGFTASYASWSSAAPLPEVGEHELRLESETETALPGRALRALTMRGASRPWVEIPLGDGGSTVTGPSHSAAKDAIAHHSEVELDFDAVVTEVTAEPDSDAEAKAKDEQACKTNEKPLRNEVELDVEALIPAGRPDTTRGNTMRGGEATICATSKSEKHMILEEDSKRKRSMFQDFEEMNGGGTFWAHVHNEIQAMRARAADVGNSRWRVLIDFVQSRWFSGPVVASIVLNALFLAVSSDLIVQQAWREYTFAGGELLSGLKTPTWIEVTNRVFVGVFALEMLCRMLAHQLNFWVGPEWAWNHMDFGLLLCSIAEITLESIDLKTSFIRVLRLMRMLRSIRLVRVLRFFRELRLLLFSVMHAVVPLLWSLVFLLLMLFVFVVISLQAVTDCMSIEDLDSTNVDRMRKHFSSLPVGLLSYFAAVSGGINWWDVWSLLTVCDPAYGWIFAIYMILMTLMVLNIITGIFVNNALEMAESNREFVLEAQMEKKKALFAHLRKLFRDLDRDGSDTVSRAELENFITSPDAQATFNALALDGEGVVAFFDLLDVDGSEELEIEEFVMGCMRLSRDVKTLEIVLLLHGNKRLILDLTTAVNRLQEEMEEILSWRSFTTRASHQSSHNSYKKKVTRLSLGFGEARL